VLGGEVRGILERAHARSEVPVALGFGIATPEQAADAAAAGADGVIVEVHPCPEEAVCDGPQALYADAFADYLRKLEAAAELAGKTFSTV